MISAIAAFAADGLGMGMEGGIPWDIPEDRQRFKEMTSGCIVVMGRRTFDSLPLRPLPRRRNVVVTSRSLGGHPSMKGVDAVSLEEAKSIVRMATFTPVFIAGGEGIYSAMMPLVNTVYATLVFGRHRYDTYFPARALEGFAIADVGQRMVSITGVRYQNVTYRRQAVPRPLPEDAYLGLLRETLRASSIRSDRTATGTLSVFGKQVRLDLSRGELPMLTTKMVPWRSIVAELLWMLRGSTDTTELSKAGVTVWDANTSRAFLDRRDLQHYQEGDMGPMYGFVWRHAGAEYGGCKKSYMGLGTDQLDRVLTQLRRDPFSRRIVLTSYHVPYLEQGCLHPCHGLVAQFYVHEDEAGRQLLSCHMYQRSQDLFLAWSFNSTAYAILTHLLAAKADMIAHELIVSYGDVHLYVDHMEQAFTQLSRPVLPPPILRMSPSVTIKNWDALSVDDFELAGYAHHPKLPAPMSL